MMSGRRARTLRLRSHPLKASRGGPSSTSTAFSLPVFGTPDIAHFYLPLLDPLKTPHLFQYPVSYVHNSFEDDRPCFILPPDGDVPHASRYYMLFHQVQTTHNLEPVMAAFSIMGEEHARMRGVQNASKDTSPPHRELPVTVVEVIAALDPGASDPLSDALDEAIDNIREFQFYYHLDTGVMVRRLTRKALPQFIPVLRRPSGESVTSAPSIMIVNEGGPMALAAAAPEISNERLTKLLQQTRHRPADMFRTFAEMRQEAHLSLLSGDYSASSLFCGISAEALLTELVLMLMWEEAKPLHEVASLFKARDNISKSLMAAIGDRLRGSWDRNGDGPVGRWQRDVADLRNRVAHLGATPSEKEIRAAFDAVELLERFVGDRLMAERNFTRYPQTVRTYLNDEGIAKRNRSAAWKKFSKAQIFPAHASTLFNLWKKEVDRLRYETQSPDAERAITVLVAYPNDARRWYLVDEVTDLACEVGAPVVDADTMKNLQTIITSTEWDVVSIHVRSTDAPLPENPVWRPSYLCLPMKSIHRWEQCLWQPPPDCSRQPSQGAVRD